MQHKLENGINSIVSDLLDDYSQGKDIDNVSGFDHPDKSVIIEIIKNFRRLFIPDISRIIPTDTTLSETT